jgi:MFS transporter, OPA family, glycerol-3-phosphate transporter
MGAVALPVDAAAAPIHSAAYRRRRFLNWFPLGLTYAFLYMGRYNLNVAKGALGSLMTEEDFGIIFFFGTLVYGFAFVLNGPLTDKIGGKKAMLISALGSAAANAVMGFYILDPATRSNADLRVWFSVLYAVNMYFQSFGAVAIVKVNASWFHVRERGAFSGIFGTMISSGIFMAYSVNAWLLSSAASLTDSSELSQSKVVFFIPSALLLLMFGIESFLLKDRPSEAGLTDFDTGDASSGEAEDVPLKTVMWKIFSNPIILTVALIEFCTGVVRQGVMQSYPFYAKSVLALPSSHSMRNGSWENLWVVAAMFATAAIFFMLAYRTQGPRKKWLYTSGGLIFLVPFLQGGWGGILFVAGVIGGNVAGYVSDVFFQSRRAPAAGGLYFVLFVCTIIMALVMGKTTAEVAESTMSIKGKVAPGSKVLVDGRNVTVDREGKYKTDARVAKGQEQVEIRVIDAEGKISSESKPVKTLRPGDKVLSVAGTKDLSDWVAVGKAIKAIPPQSCVDPKASWDPKTKECSINPSGEIETAPASTGTIAIEIERDGQPITLALDDWAQKQRAGEPRVIKATPVATMPAWVLGIVVFLMSLCVIGTHGLLSGTATMDFGGRKGAATAVGMIDGFVYLGTAVQSIGLGYLTSRSWSYWPWFLMPFSLVGFLLCLRIWNAKPKPKSTPA